MFHMHSYFHSNRELGEELSGVLFLWLGQCSHHYIPFCIDSCCGLETFPCWLFENVSSKRSWDLQLPSDAEDPRSTLKDSRRVRGDLGLQMLLKGRRKERESLLMWSEGWNGGKLLRRSHLDPWNERRRAGRSRHEASGLLSELQQTDLGYVSKQSADWSFAKRISRTIFCSS